MYGFEVASKSSLIAYVPLSHKFVLVGDVARYKLVYGPGAALAVRRHLIYHHAVSWLRKPIVVL